jgi:hypothetical protein
VFRLAGRGDQQLNRKLRRRVSASERVIQMAQDRRDSPAWENYHENLDSFFGLYDARHSGAR